jgi:hypothetical protein
MRAERNSCTSAITSAITLLIIIRRICLVRPSGSPSNFKLRSYKHDTPCFLLSRPPRLPTSEPGSLRLPRRTATVRQSFRPFQRLRRIVDIISVHPPAHFAAPNPDLSAATASTATDLQILHLSLRLLRSRVTSSRAASPRPCLSRSANCRSTQ